MDTPERDLRGDPAAPNREIVGTRDPHASAASSADPIPAAIDPPKDIALSSVVADMRKFCDSRRGFDQTAELANRVDGWADRIEDAL